MRAGAAAILALVLGSTAPAAPVAAPTPVVIELFTSEGCSDCPPADALLEKLVTTQPVAGAQIIGLGQHVDYWDRLGWKDRFSSAAVTNRQQIYGARFGGDSIYTPQMVVDGAAEFVGSDAGAAQRAVTRAAAAPHGTVVVDVSEHAKPSAADLAVLAVSVAVRDLPAIDRGEHVDVTIAVTEDRLKSDVTRGENRGRTLSHTAVVRDLRTIGEASASGPSIARGELTLGAGWRRPSLKIVAFVQERRSRRILAAAVAPLDATRP